MNQQTKKLTTAILNEGKDNSFFNVSSEGFDIGIHDKGIGTIVAGGKHTTSSQHEKWWEKTWIQLIMILSAILGVIGFIMFVYMK